MKRIAVVLLAVAALSAQADEKLNGVAPVSGEMLVGMQVVVASDGRITEVVPDAGVTEPLRKMLIQRVSQWRYKSGIWEGKPVSLTHVLVLRLQPVPTPQGGFALQVKGEGNVFLLGTRYAMTPPRFPVNEAKKGKGMNLIYEVTKQEDGRLSEIRLLESTQADDRATRAFDVASRPSLDSARLPPSIVDGKPIRCRMVWPMNFMLSDARKPKDAEQAEAEAKAHRVRMEALQAGLPDGCPPSKLETPIEATLL